MAINDAAPAKIYLSKRRSDPSGDDNYGAAAAAKRERIFTAAIGVAAGAIGAATLMKPMAAASSTMTAMAMCAAIFPIMAWHASPTRPARRLRAQHYGIENEN